MGCTMVRYIYARSVVIEKSGYVSLWSPGITLCLFWAPFHSHNYRQLNVLLDSKGIYLETLVWILKLRWDFFKKKKKKTCNQYDTNGKVVFIYLLYSDSWTSFLFNDHLLKVNLIFNRQIYMNWNNGGEQPEAS